MKLISKLFLHTGDNIKLNEDSPKVRMAMGLSQDTTATSRLSDDGVEDIQQYIRMSDEIEKERLEDEASLDRSVAAADTSDDSSFEVDNVSEDEEVPMKPLSQEDSFDSLQQGQNEERCIECGRRPCVFVKYEHELDEMYNEMMEDVVSGSNMTTESKHALFRLNAYRNANSWLGGARGKGNRTALPKCMEDGIRSIAPSEFAYTGFKDK